MRISRMTVRLPESVKNGAEEFCKKAHGMSLHHYFEVIASHFWIMERHKEDPLRVIGSFHRGGKHYITSQHGTTLLCPCNSGNTCLLKEEEESDE